MNDIEIQTSETEFKKMAPEDRDWQILKTFHEQTRVCDNRFLRVEGRVGECTTTLDKRYIRRAWEKLPVSKAELVAYLLFIGMLVGMGMIEFTAIAKWLPK
jgi:hypothetical protein